MAKKSRYHQGEYQVINPKKYVGSLPVIFRSSWEKKFMIYCDTNKNILSWSSESIIVLYYNPIKKRMARYFPDFTVTIKEADNTIINWMVEIKPYKESHPPIRKQGKRKQTLLREEITWVQNREKWLAAKAYCAERNWCFKVITEYELFNMKKKPKR